MLSGTTFLVTTPYFDNFESYQNQKHIQRKHTFSVFDILDPKSSGSNCRYTMFPSYEQAYNPSPSLVQHKSSTEWENKSWIEHTALADPVHQILSPLSWDPKATTHVSDLAFVSGSVSVNMFGLKAATSTGASWPTKQTLLCQSSLYMMGATQIPLFSPLTVAIADPSGAQLLELV